MNIGKYKFIVPVGHPIYFRRLSNGTPVFNDVPGVTFHGTTTATSIPNSIDPYVPYIQLKLQLK